MKTMELEQMTLEELFSVKGGIWVVVDGVQIWVETYRLDPGSEGE